MSNENTPDTPDVSGLTMVNESLSGIGALHPKSMQKSLAGISDLRPNASAATSNTSQAQPVASSTQTANQASNTQANNSNSKVK